MHREPPISIDLSAGRGGDAVLSDLPRRGVIHEPRAQGCQELDGVPPLVLEALEAGPPRAACRPRWSPTRFLRLFGYDMVRYGGSSTPTSAVRRSRALSGRPPFGIALLLGSYGVVVGGASVGGGVSPEGFSGMDIKELSSASSARI